MAFAFVPLHVFLVFEWRFAAAGGGGSTLTSIGNCLIPTFLHRGVIKIKSVVCNKRNGAYITFGFLFFVEDACFLGPLWPLGRGCDWDQKVNKKGKT